MTLTLPPFITSIAIDSRQVEPGGLFCAIKGVDRDGAEYIHAAIERGAAAILTRPGIVVPAGVLHLVAENDRLAAAQLAAQCYAPQPSHVVAVTGTDGKTSTADFFRQLLELTGHRAASLGTLGLNSTTVQVDAPALNTSPDPVLLHKTLQKIGLQGGTYVAIEASSHGLHQYRLHGLELSAAAFTNLGRDHLDYHGTIENYFAAKMILFGELLAMGKTAVIYADDPRAAQVEALCQSRGHRVLRYGSQGEIAIEALTPLATGMAVEWRFFGQPHYAELAMIGDFQAMNLSAAIGLALGCGIALETMLPVLPQIRSVRGRLELAGTTKHGAAVYVDYAHTPAALEKALRVMRHHTAAKLSVVFGCGGDRDKGKRPEMGRVACELAERVYLADDNPRSEAPATIRNEILAGCTDKARNIGDRATAIATAIAELQSGDILLIAGKGHETYQLIGGQTLPFDDAEEVRKNL